MLVYLNRNNQNMTEESIIKVMNFIKHSMVNKKFPIEIVDEKGLMNNKDLRDIIQKIREIDTDGFMYILLSHDCKHMCSKDWAFHLGNLTRDIKSVFVPIDINPEDNIENIRNLLEESLLIDKIHFNVLIDKENFDITRIFNIMPKYNIHNYVTLSIDHSKKLDYKAIAKSIVNMTPARKKRSIALEFGCGYRSCMFEDKDIGNLFRSPMIDMAFFCRPRIAINPDLSINYCNNPDSYKLHLDNMKNIQDMFEQFELAYEGDNGALKECETCWNKNKICSGGCPIYN